MQETIRVDRDLSEIRHVRAWMAGVLERAEVADGLVDDVLLMVSELVTNVLRHTESAPEVQVEVAARRIRVEVADDDPTLPVERPADADPDLPGGWGLPVVHLLADEWGADPSPSGGKTVWFTMRLDGRGRA
ncbi:MAG: ATP-binding protein [Acidimicrobiales bacterium]